MTLREVDPSYLPIGSHRLAEFRRHVQPTDVFYYYDSDPEEWDRGMGSEATPSCGTANCSIR